MATIPRRNPLSKLDLPGTLEDFAGLAGLKPGSAGYLQSRPYFFKATGQQVVAGGVAAVTFGKPPVGYYWKVGRIVVKNGGAGSSAFVYVGGVADSFIADQTDSANQDVADQSTPIYVSSEDEFQVRVTGGTNGNIFTVNIQVEAVPS